MLQGGAYTSSHYYMHVFNKIQKPKCKMQNANTGYSVKLRLSLAFGKRYSRALRGSPAVVKEAGAVP